MAEMSEGAPAPVEVLPDEDEPLPDEPEPNGVDPLPLEPLPLEPDPKGNEPLPAEPVPPPEPVAGEVAAAFELGGRLVLEARSHEPDGTVTTP